MHIIVIDYTMHSTVTRAWASPGRLEDEPVQVGWRRRGEATGPVSGAYGGPVEVTEERGNEV
jgi:hypothetical protein